MIERIVEIIVYFVSELRQNKKMSEVDTNKLNTLGYSPIEISTAVSWMVDRLESAQEVLGIEIFNDKNSFRVLNEFEKALFTQDAWGEVIQLKTLGLLSNYQIENMIEKASMMGYNQIDSTQLKYYVATAIFNAEDIYSSSARIMLRGNEVIN